MLTDEEEALERYKVVIHAMQDVLFGVRGGWAHVAKYRHPDVISCVWSMDICFFECDDDG